MTTLSIPLHRPMRQTENLLIAELTYREVKSVKVRDGRMEITYDRIGQK